MLLGGTIPVNPNDAHDARTIFRDYGLRLKAHVPEAYLDAAASGDQSPSGTHADPLNNRLVLVGGGGKMLGEFLVVSKLFVEHK